MSAEVPSAERAREPARHGSSLEVPPGYEVESAPDVLYVVERSRRAALERAGFDARREGTFATSELAGRKPLAELALGGETLLVRRFTHGGLLRLFTGRRFLDRERPLAELVLSSRLSAAGVRTPHVVAARARRARPLGWHLDLVVERVAGALDLEALLERVRRGDVTQSELRLVATALGVLVRRLHDLGFVHADLTPKNVLVERASLATGAPLLWLIDLDRSRFVASLGAAERRDNLRRLWRYVERREERDGAALARTDVARFFLGYDRAGSEWKADWRAIAVQHRRSAAVHGLGWWLDSLFGSGRTRGASHIS